MGGGALWSFVPPHHSLLPTAQPSFPPPPAPRRPSAPRRGGERQRGTWHLPGRPPRDSLMELMRPGKAREVTPPRAATCRSAPQGANELF